MSLPNIAETAYPHVAGTVSPQQREHLAVIAEKLPHWFCWHRACGDPGREGRAPLNPSKVKREGITPGPVSGVSAADPARAGAALPVALSLLPIVDGVGCALFTADDGVVILDLDHVRDAVTGQLNCIGVWALGHLAGCYVEISPSGTGLRAVFTGTVLFEKKKFFPVDQNGKKILGPDGKETAIEIFRAGTGLYTRMTGALVRGVGVAQWVDGQPAIDWVGRLLTDSLAAKEKQGAGSGGVSSPVNGGTSIRSLSIDQVLDRLETYRGNEGKSAHDVRAALNLSASRSASGKLAEALRLMSSGAEKSEHDHLVMCEAFRRGLGTLEDAAELLTALVDRHARPKVDRKDYQNRTSENAAREVLKEIETPGFNRNSFRAQVWGNLPDKVEDNTPASLPDGMAEVLQASGEVLVRTRHGKVIPTPGNVKTILITDARTCDVMAFNESTQDVERCGSWRVFDQHAADKTGNLQDIDISFTQAWFLSAWGMNLKKGDVCEGIEMAARAKSYDPMRDRLLKLVWDGEPRVRNWLQDFAMIDDTGCAEYVSEAGTCFLVGAVARALNPGCQFDTMLTVEGSGGGGKSTMFQILADAVGPDLFTDSVHDVTNSVHVVECTEGKFIVEIAELSGVRKASDVESLKKALVVRRDKVRKPYMRKPVELPRRWVFVGTTNSSTYIADPTGAASRRFLPVHTLATERNPIDRVALAYAAPQLWAEAVHLFQTGQRIYIDPNSEAGKQWASERGERQEDLPFEEEVNQLVIDIAAGKVERYRVRDGKRGGITANDAAVAMGLDAVGAKEGKYGTRVAAALRHRGFIALPKSNGARLWYMPPELFSAAARMVAEREEETSL